MNRPVECRRAAAGDLPAVARLKLAMFADAGLAHLLAGDAERRVLAAYQGFYAKDAAAHFLGVADGRPVALAGAFLKADIPYCFYAEPRYGFVGDVYTLPAWRGQGLARRLSLEALAWLRGQGVATVRLLASAQGRGLYESLGFAPSDEMVLRIG